MNAAARTLRNADHRSLAPLALTITLVLAALLVAAALAVMFVLSDSGHGAGDKTGPTWGERDATFVEPTPSTLPRRLNQRIQVPG